MWVNIRTSTTWCRDVRVSANCHRLSLLGWETSAVWGEDAGADPGDRVHPGSDKDKHCKTNTRILTLPLAGEEERLREVRNLFGDTGLGCCFTVARSNLTLRDTKDCSTPGSPALSPGACSNSCPGACSNSCPSSR